MALTREVEREMHEAAENELTAKLTKARYAAAAYFREQDADARRLGYKSHCEFAHLIARGVVKSPPVIDVEGMEIVGGWFNERTDVNQWALRFQFDTTHGGIAWKRMKEKYRQGWNRDKFNRRIRELLRDLGGRL
jgi:hypothetical protein